LHEELVQKYDRHILSLAFSYARNSDDAKDIYQETLIRAFRAIRKFEMRSEFSTWLYRITTNVCLRFKSSQRRYSDVFRRDPPQRQSVEGNESRPEPLSSQTAEGDFMRAELGRQIERALGLLSPMQRLVFTMKHYEGYKLREIASITNCAEGTIKKYLFEAVRRLQKELEAAL
ncbi:MAG: RNA polymerase sigma factor, partial [Bacteroidetes bacterium]|nr:RNA polymerase sigma factor [Bacteroidota bacterium]